MSCFFKKNSCCILICFDIETKQLKIWTGWYKSVILKEKLMNINNGFNFNTIATYCETCSMQYSYSIETYWYHHHWLQDFLLSTISTQTLTIAFLTLCHFITIRRREEGGNTCEEAPYTQKTIQKLIHLRQSRITNDYTQLSWRLEACITGIFFCPHLHSHLYLLLNDHCEEFTCSEWELVVWRSRVKPLRKYRVKLLGFWRVQSRILRALFVLVPGIGEPN